MAGKINKRGTYGYKDDNGKIVETFRTKFAANLMKREFELRKFISVEIVDLREKDD